VIAATLLLAVTLGPAPDPACTSDTLRAKYEAGVEYATFLAAARQRRDQWEANTAAAVALDSAVVARAEAVPGAWRLLIVTVDSCGDSVNSVPYIAALVDRLDRVDLRILSPEAGRSIQEAHRTPDGRVATPTVVLLDEAWNDRGCFVERAPQLRAHVESLPSSERGSARMAWYQADAGRTTVAEVVGMLEAASRGEVQCR
jgi:hypothetical protein